MRIATFNIRHGERGDGRGTDAALLAEVCVALDVDILALQEVDRGVRRSGRADLAGAVAAATGMHLAFGAALRTGGGEYGNALLARLPIEDVTVLALPRPDRREPRAAVVGSIAGMTVAATHLGLLPDESLQQLLALVAALEGRARPRVILGDFNRHPDQVVPVLVAAGYRVAESDLTFPADSPRARIDYVAVAGLDVLGTEVVATAVSDHSALIAITAGPEDGVGEPEL